LTFWRFTNRIIIIIIIIIISDNELNTEGYKLYSNDLTGNGRLFVN